MKKLLTILCLVLLVSCSPPSDEIEILKEETVLREGIRYEKNTTTPFNGVLLSSSDYKKSGYRENYKNGIWDGPRESFGKNGRLREITNWKNGKKDGLSESYNDKGQVVGRWYHKNGEVVSFERFNVNNELETINKYKNGEIILSKTFDRRGNELTDLEYINGKKSGRSVDFYFNGQLKEEGQYIDGKKEGVWKIFHDNGRLYREQYWNNGEKTGTWRSFDRNGVDVSNDVFENFYDDGVLEVRGRFVQGKKDGFWETNIGSYTWIENWDNGKREGLFETKQFTMTRYLENYKNNKKHGKTEEYSTVGNLLFQGNYKNGKKDGVWEYFYDNYLDGNTGLKRTETYEEGNIVLSEKWKDGDLIKTERYKDGELIE